MNAAYTDKYKFADRRKTYELMRNELEEYCDTDCFTAGAVVDGDPFLGGWVEFKPYRFGNDIIAKYGWYIARPKAKGSDRKLQAYHYKFDEKFCGVSLPDQFIKRFICIKAPNKDELEKEIYYEVVTPVLLEKSLTALDKYYSDVVNPAFIKAIEKRLKEASYLDYEDILNALIPFEYGSANK